MLNKKKDEENLERDLSISVAFINIEKLQTHFMIESCSPDFSTIFAKKFVS